MNIKEKIKKDLIKIIDATRPVFFGMSDEIHKEDWEFELRAAIFGNISHYFDKDIPPYNKELMEK